MATVKSLVYNQVDKEIVDGCIAGRRDCQEALYRHFSPKMFGICLRYANDYHSAEDILQEGFIKVFHNIDRFRGDGSFEGWMKRIFVNTAIEYYRKSMKYDNSTDLSEVKTPLAGADAIQQMSAEELMKLVHQLSPGYRAVFNMYVVEGYSHKEIAEKLGISEGTSKSQLARARTLLQKMVTSLNISYHG